MKPSQIRLPISGMKCQTCVKKVTGALKRVDGVKGVAVSLENKVADIEIEFPWPTRKELIKAVKSAGFYTCEVEHPKLLRDETLDEFSPPSQQSPDEIQTVVFSVLGMSCYNCAQTIEKGIQKINGAVSASVNFSSETLSVQYLPNILNEADIISKVGNLGYKLLPENASENNESRTQLVWLIYSAVLALPIMPLMWFSHNHEKTVYTVFVLSSLLQFTAGLTFYRSAWASLKNRFANMDVLVAMGITAAYGYSVFALFGVFGDIQEAFFETSAMLILFIRFGKWLEIRARGRASQALKALLQLQPDRALLLDAGKEKEVAADSLHVGDQVVVRPGQKVPVDGIVVEGESVIDESMITGESVPVPKKQHDKVTGGTINIKSRVVIEATNIGNDTVLAQIVRMVENAQRGKAPIQRLADVIASWFVPAVVIIALATFAAWNVVLNAEFLFAFKMAIAVLVIACPCALGLATPTAIMVGSSIGLSAGILFKQAAVLENIARLQVLLFDKTGTLTRGEFEITDISYGDDLDQRDIIKRAAGMASTSNHPLATAIVKYAQENAIDFIPCNEIEETGGLGLASSAGHQLLLLGNQRLMECHGIDIAGFDPSASMWIEQGKTVLYFAADGKLSAVFALADGLKEGAVDTISQLNRLGLKTVMISGDRQAVAEAVARQLGIDKFEAEVLPGDKLDVVRSYQERGYLTGMAGDGINDAPALAQADVGIAVGTGTDVAKESGDLVLVKGDICDVERAIRLGRKTLVKIKQNLFWAFFYNLVGLPVAAGLFYVPYGVALKPEYAGLAMAFSSVCVVSNSLLLKRYAKKL